MFPKVQSGLPSIPLKMQSHRPSSSFFTPNLPKLNPRSHKSNPSESTGINSRAPREPLSESLNLR